MDLLVRFEQFVGRNTGDLQTADVAMRYFAALETRARDDRVAEGDIVEATLSQVHVAEGAAREIDVIERRAGHIYILEFRVRDSVVLNLEWICHPSFPLSKPQQGCQVMHAKICSGAE